MLSRLLALAVAAAGSLALVACGGDDRLSGSEYRAELAKQDRKEAKAHADVEKAFKAKSVDEISTRMARFANDQQRLGDEVADLNPPKDAKAANAQLARGAHHLAADIRETVALLADVESPAAAIKLLNRRLEKAAQELDAGLDKLHKLGYTEGGG